MDGVPDGHPANDRPRGPRRRRGGRAAGAVASFSLLFAGGAIEPVAFVGLLGLVLVALVVSEIALRSLVGSAKWTLDLDRSIGV